MFHPLNSKVMTKQNFIKLWSHIERICKKKVNGELSITAICEVSPCPDSYRLVLMPRVIMWPDELCALVGLSGMQHVSLYFNFKEGSIEIF